MSAAGAAPAAARGAGPGRRAPAGRVHVRTGGRSVLPCDRVGEGLARGARGRSGVVRAGEGESPLGGVEVCAVGEGEQDLMAEGGGDGTVEQVRHVSPLAGVP